MKRPILCILLLLTLALPALAENPLNIVCTTFPLYDWTCAVLGQDSDAQVTLLIRSGIDLHSFQPAASDLIALMDCDLFIDIGGESDSWAVAALAQTEHDGRAVLHLIDAIPQSRLQETEHHHEDEAHDEHDEHEPDEHIWLSLPLAADLCVAIRDAVSALDSAHADVYACNTEAYCAQLLDLDARYREICDAAPQKTLIFADRFPFAYLAEDYGLTCYAAFSGCGAENEASFATVVGLSAEVNALSIPAVCVLESSDGKLAATVLSGAGKADAPIIVFDSLQSVNAKQITDGADYLQAMEYNLKALRTALYGLE